MCPKLLTHWPPVFVRAMNSEFKPKTNPLSLPYLALESKCSGVMSFPTCLKDIADVYYKHRQAESQRKPWTGREKLYSITVLRLSIPTDSDSDLFAHP